MKVADGIETARWHFRAGSEELQFFMSQGRKNSARDFPGGPVVKTLRSQCKGPRVQSLVRELDPACYN